ncbi:Glyoxalase/Bleomycin resistance protein/Dihydroxybiphenyl dioxygenase [Rhexocercosporidium sp. MPI-PUGE-AT-0058]|nr:Glyoxalase/Bleomycin resistance protein/Dihydroxybiphenyl dioxygenase [Rhexocercosporidium sp. MPI-PUGE-AT-0058]
MFTLRRTPLQFSKLLRSLPLIPKSTLISQSRMSSSKPAATVQSLDHIVLTVSSIPKTTKWYTSHLGMRSESFVSDSSPDITRYSLVFGEQKINLHESGKEFEPKATHVQPGSGDLCFITKDPISTVHERLKEVGVEIVDLSPEKADSDGTVLRTGARGRLRSVYCRDPDGNLVEYVCACGVGRRFEEERRKGEIC